MWPGRGKWTGRWEPSWELQKVWEGLVGLGSIKGEFRNNDYVKWIKYMRIKWKRYRCQNDKWLDECTCIWNRRYMTVRWKGGKYKCIPEIIGTGRIGDSSVMIISPKGTPIKNRGTEYRLLIIMNEVIKLRSNLKQVYHNYHYLLHYSCLLLDEICNQQKFIYLINKLFHCSTC